MIGWALDRTLEDELTLAALRMALASRRVQPGLVHHSDRGSQYASTAYQLAVEVAGMRHSSSRRGNCRDSVVAESFFGTLEQELGAA